MLKILVVGHSMVHPRQQWFFRKLGSIAGHCTIVGPKTWGNLTMNDMANKTFSMVSLIAFDEGNLFEYTLLGAEEVIEELKPDVIYCQAELRSIQAMRTLNAALQNNIPFVIFLWENIFSPKTKEELFILEQAILIICGNREAKSLIPKEYQDKCRIIPQVGIELDYFKPYFNIEKKYDVIFCGRPVPEKGIEIIKKGCEELNCSLNIIQGKEYEKIPKLLCEGRIFASLPITTPMWKEQSGSYANLEAMACGLPVITTRCGAILEYLGIGTAAHCDENNLESFITVLKSVVFDKELRNQMIDLGFIKAKEYSNETIATKLLEVLKECISETK